MSLDDKQVSDRISAGLPGLPEVVASASLTAGLTAYLHELQRWNKAYNLTAVRDPDAMVSRHVFDSLSALPYVQGKHVLDVGTGAGLPGIPLAMCMPDSSLVLVDSNGKKIRFLEHVIAELGLLNVQALQVRVESYKADYLFDSIISRAYSSLREFVESSGRLLSVDGRLVAMKGKYPQQEIDELPAGWQPTCSDEVQVPNVEGERHIIVLQRC
jgi:16S rRNA (guanine527-N7)-methyltransferase